MKIITVEEHFINPALQQAIMPEIERLAPSHLKAFSPEQGFHSNMDFAAITDIGEGRIANMDGAGLDMQVLSCNGPSAELLLSDEAIPLVRQVNDQLAAAVAVHPDRFAGFAALPMSQPAAAVTELRRCMSELHFKGAVINGTVHERFLDEPDFEPVLAAAAELDAPLYLHPSIINRNVRDAYYTFADPAFTSRFASAGYGWHVETGIQAVRLILSGVFDRYPNLQIILGHWGEMIPYMMDRINHSFSGTATPTKHDFEYYIRNNVYVTPSGLFNMPQFTNTLEMVGADRILYSVDYPYYKNEGAREFLENAPISQDDKEKIGHLNAEKLLKI